MQDQKVEQTSAPESRLIGRIPVRNIWLLFLYASNLAQFHGQHAAAVEEFAGFPGTDRPAPLLRGRQTSAPEP